MTKHNLSYAREVWRAAMTLANNLCVQVSDESNAGDDVEEATGASHCAERVRGWLAPSDEQLLEMFAEAGVQPPKADPLPDSIQWALNSGDGTYRP